MIFTLKMGSFKNCLLKGSLENQKWLHSPQYNMNFYFFQCCKHYMSHCEVMPCLFLCRPQVVELQQQQVLVLEDDVRFEPSFKSRLNTIMEDVKQSGLQWDLMWVWVMITLLWSRELYSSLSIYMDPPVASTKWSLVFACVPILSSHLFKLCRA